MTRLQKTGVALLILFAFPIAVRAADMNAVRAELAEQEAAEAGSDEGPVLDPAGAS